MGISPTSPFFCFRNHIVSVLMNDLHKLDNIFKRVHKGFCKTERQKLPFFLLSYASAPKYAVRLTE